jgi:hypothetical protein
MKVVRSLFLDDLRTELDAIRTDRSTRRAARLDEYQKKLASLRFFDPACGCGNFLVVTYREMRSLELEVLKLMHGQQTEMKLDEVNKLSRLDVDQMYGIEVEEFPARIAEVALWLADHQANMDLSIAFTQRYIRIPLRKSPHIHVGNALRMDWEKDVLPAAQCSYVLGNPPFVGKTYQTPDQKADMEFVCGDVDSSGLLDYVTGWYFKAAQYISGTNVRVAFVSTNSISQGEQPGILWDELFGRWRLKIHFAHRTFPWESEARGGAHVHVVIIGFGARDCAPKRIFDYDGDKAHANITVASNINPYLVEGGDSVLRNRQAPLCAAPEIINGNKQVDGGFLILDESERREVMAREPGLKKFIRLFIGSEELISGDKRWCFWLLNAEPHEIRDSPELKKRVEGVRNFRLNSKKIATQRDANKPSLFSEIRYTDGDYLAIPEVSSERRPYIPIGYLDSGVIPSNKIQVLRGATSFHFGVICSRMHMSWMRVVTGRMKSDYSYSAKIVYNNFPWPQSLTPDQKAAVEKAAQGVLDAREQFPGSTLADLYDPVAMPPALAKAHAELDRAVDRAYRKEPFASDRARVEFLFRLYEQLTAPLVAAAAAPKRKRRTR